MAAAEKDFVLEQGKTFLKTLTFKQNDVAIDITDWQFRGQIRKSPGSVTLIGSFDFTILTQSGATLGQVQVAIPASETEDIPVNRDCSGEETVYSYDIEVEKAGGIVDGVLRGKITVIPEVTKA